MSTQTEEIVKAVEDLVDMKFQELRYGAMDQTSMKLHFSALVEQSKHKLSKLLSKLEKKNEVLYQGDTAGLGNDSSCIDSNTLAVGLELPALAGQEADPLQPTADNVHSHSGVPRSAG